MRTLLMLVMCGVFAAWFAYDGWVGYPSKNIQEYLEQLSPEQRDRVKELPIYKTVTPQTLSDARKIAKKIGRATQLKAFETLYGARPSFQDIDAWYYFGPSFWVKVRLKGGKAWKVIGKKSGKSSSDLWLQKALGVGLGVISFGFFIVMLRVLGTHLILNDKGLRWRRTRLIRWDEMKSLDTTHFQKKGWIALIYENNGHQRAIRLDEYHLARFDDIINRICTTKGFTNPFAKN